VEVSIVGADGQWPIGLEAFSGNLGHPGNATKHKPI
jgi:hypothetical protein